MTFPGWRYGKKTSPNLAAVEWAPQTRGLEFGSTPSPVPRREAFAVAPLFDTPTFTTVPAKGKITVSYVCFLAQVPENFGAVRDIQVGKNEILVQGSGRRSSVHLPAAGLGDNG